MIRYRVHMYARASIRHDADVDKSVAATDLGWKCVKM